MSYDQPTVINSCANSPSVKRRIRRIISPSPPSRSANLKFCIRAIQQKVVAVGMGTLRLGEIECSFAGWHLQVDNLRADSIKNAADLLPHKAIFM